MNRYKTATVTKVTRAVIQSIANMASRQRNTPNNDIHGLLEALPEGTVPEAELVENKEKTNRHLRLSELLQEHSDKAEMIMITLTLPRKNQISAPLYLAWLDIMTRGLPPTLLIRGNQSSVLTFHSISST